MKVLAIDSSSVVAGVAILDGDQLLYEVYHHHKRNHSEILMPLVEEALHSSDLMPGDIDLFAVSGGPGSFTGLRIGVSTVKGLAQAVEKPVVAVPTLDAMAWNFVSTNAIVCPIMDARRNQVYTSVYRWQRDDCIKLMPYSALPLEELIEHLNSYNEAVTYVGDGISAYRSLLEEKMGKRAIFAPPYLAYQRASVIAHLGQKQALAGNVIHYRDLKPFYLRLSQAEQKRKQKEEAQHGATDSSNDGS
ncbi:MAG: tRNA (adenosine(37)-N6)-threonylcarbamoyltransferase complex dimerization subunit type 1 TsaB [Clostridiales bacterium]|nr:tRNA (adenosine(37)-N6)-threonylcarbamoyltransferase complex dimerization subunit type 1 TsaB [Clostridiales bacterium]